jgi:hypothetical protein
MVAMYRPTSYWRINGYNDTLEALPVKPLRGGDDDRGANQPGRHVAASLHTEPKEGNKRERPNEGPNVEVSKDAVEM